MTAGSEILNELRTALAGSDLARPLVVACSGGADSTALALAAHAVAPFLVLAHVDHGVHADHARAAAAVAALAQRLDAEFALAHLALAASEHDEAAMRARRYSALVAIARKHGAAIVLTAHHADDELETLVLRLERGTGLRGLAGIPSRRELAPGITVVRPFLEVRKSKLIAAVVEAGLVPVEDPTNSDLAKARNRVRNAILPQLRTVHGAALDANLFGILRAARGTAAVLSRSSTDLLAKHCRRIDAATAAFELPTEPIARPFLADVFGEIHKLLTGGHAASRWCERAVELARDPRCGRLVVGGSELAIERTRTGLWFSHTRRAGTPPAAPQGLTLDAGESRFGNTLHRLALTSLPASSSTSGARSSPPLVLTMNAGSLPWAMRCRRPGDRFAPATSERSVELAKYLSAQAIPRLERERLPLLVDRTDRILAIAGVAVSALARSTQSPQSGAHSVLLHSRRE